MLHLSICFKQPSCPRQTTVQPVLAVMRAKPLILSILPTTYLLDNEIKVNEASSKAVRHPGLCFKALLL